jgi:quercetin dioxygenase-like cupin family protein
MKPSVIHEDDVEALDLPGRRLSWLVTSDSLDARHCSMCLIRVAPGQTVRPAHSHPNGEEVIYVITGAGRVMIEGVVHPVRAGSAVLFPQGKVHMLQNSGTEEMKVACFFAPPSSLETYKFFEDIDFPAHQETE